MPIAWAIVGLVVLIAVAKGVDDINASSPYLFSTIGYLLLYLAAVAVPVGIGFSIYNSDGFQRGRDRRDLNRQYHKASKNPFPPAKEFLSKFAGAHAKDLAAQGNTPLIAPLRERLLLVIAKLYTDVLCPPIPDPAGRYPAPLEDLYFERLKEFSNPDDALLAAWNHQRETVALEDIYMRRNVLLDDPTRTLNVLSAELRDFALAYSDAMPASLHVTKDLKEPTDVPFEVGLRDVVDPVAVAATLQTILSRPKPYLLFTRVTPHFDPLSMAAGTSPYSPLVDDVKVPFGMLADEERFQHQWIVAPSGTGKTTLLETLISCDLPRVARGEASVFIMDSQNELIPKLAAMKVFHPGGALAGKLIVLEPDPEFPLALNIFDNQLGDLRHFSPEDRENLYASSLEMADFVMSGLLGADLTAKQKGIFRYITQALQAIPGATIHTFADLLTPEGYEKHRAQILMLDEYTVDFFERRFNTQMFRATKEEIFWRLDAIMSNTTFRRMFSHPKNKLNLFEELQGAKVVCVNTKLGLLKKEGTEIFGRYFLAMLLQATERRMLIDKSKRLPTFCYIDECQDYIAEEPKMASLLDKARKQRVSFTLAHQRLANIRNADVQDALANVRVKYAARNRTDASVLAKLMALDPEVLSATPDYHFYVNAGRRSVLVTCPPNRIDDAPKAAPEALAAFRADMRSRYAAPVSEPRGAPREPVRVQSPAPAAPQRAAPQRAPAPVLRQAPPAPPQPISAAPLRWR